ncbi:MAG: hypothetical protein H7308_00600 [Chthonomonadaceae bacterium]|nr:hypothetical protein [Chthonomonadaceae bacterium]
MSDFSVSSNPETATTTSRTLNQLFAEMWRLNAHMRQEQAEIDRLKAETDALKQETIRQKAETQAIFARIEVIV